MKELADTILESSMGRHMDPEKGPDEWDVSGFAMDLKEYFREVDGAPQPPDVDLDQPVERTSLPGLAPVSSPFSKIGVPVASCSVSLAPRKSSR